VKTEPKVPAEYRNLILKRTVIEVEVEIDRKGKVIRAESVPQKGVSVYLVKSAIEAAWSWKFKAARSNDEPVASKWNFQFVFNP
jgi:outer membrane biosynthesis protein TonB